MRERLGPFIKHCKCGENLWLDSAHSRERMPRTAEIQPCLGCGVVSCYTVYCPFCYPRLERMERLKDLGEAIKKMAEIWRAMRTSIEKVKASLLLYDLVCLNLHHEMPITKQTLLKKILNPQNHADDCRADSCEWVMRYACLLSPDTELPPTVEPVIF